MIIESKKSTKNVIFLSKSGFRLFEFNIEKGKKDINNNFPYLTTSTKETKELSKTMDVNKSLKIKK